MEGKNAAVEINKDLSRGWQSLRQPLALVGTTVFLQGRQG